MWIKRKRSFCIHHKTLAPTLLSRFIVMIASLNWFDFVHVEKRCIFIKWTFIRSIYTCHVFYRAANNFFFSHQFIPWNHLTNSTCGTQIKYIHEIMQHLLMAIVIKMFMCVVLLCFYSTEMSIELASWRENTNLIDTPWIELYIYFVNDIFCSSHLLGGRKITKRNLKGIVNIFTHQHHLFVLVSFCTVSIYI